MNALTLAGVGRCALALALAACIAPAWSATRPQNSEAQRTFQQEKARCLRGDSQQPRETCLKEANAAYAEARRGELGNDASPGELARNATQRCEAQPRRDRRACMKRMRPGHAEGSVGGGGMLREAETRVRR